MVEEILPDRSSVEEIEGKSPIIKIKTCFKWKGKNPSGILRMEVSLFSGFEPTSLPPLLMNLEQTTTEMLHGYYDNNMWFVFANVSSGCPVCVQYSIRSAFVISSIRPSYARIFPVAREDLAADTFFHTQMGSSLLKDITDDDLITWFNKNETSSGDSVFKEGANCQKIFKLDKETTTAAPIESTTDFDHVNTNTPHPSSIENPDVVTYTINVDSGSLNNLGLKETTTRNFAHTSTTPLPTTEKILATEHAPTTEKILTLIVENQEDDIQKLSRQKNVSPPLDNVIVTKRENILHKENKTSSANKSVIAKQNSKTNKEVDVSYPSKHVNTKKIELPLKYLDTKDRDDNEPETFSPENKNDKYLLLDKEQLWGLLKEVVNDVINKKTSFRNTNGKTLS